MIGAVDNQNIFRDFSSNVSSDYTSKKNFLASAYAPQSSANQPKVQYYNDTIDIKKKETKKTALKVFIGIASATIATTALLGTRKIDLSKFSSGMGEKIKDIQKLHIGKKIANAMGNATNIKDDLWDRLAQKCEDTPLSFLNKCGKKLTGFYRDIVSKATKKPYETAYDNLIKAGGSNLGAEKFDNWFKKLNGEIFESLHKKDERITDNLFNKNFLKKITETNIADDKLDDIIKKASTQIEIPKDAPKELAKAIEEFNAAKLKTAETILPKLRDINIGSAPTDVITVLILPLTTLGVAMGCAKNDEERKSIGINLGIPLLTAMATTTYATIRCLSGATAMIFGLALGQVASISAKIIDKFTTKQKEEINKFLNTQKQNP